MSLFGSYKQKKSLYFNRVVDKKIYQYDRWRFAMMIFLVVLLSLFYILENGFVYLPADRYVQKAVQGSSLIYDPDSYSRILNEQTSCGFDYLLEDFDFVSQEPYVGLGRYDREKMGYFGEYLVDEEFEVFLPHDFSDATFFAKNGSSLFVEPDNFDETRVEPEICGQRLVYDEIYPSVMYVRMFNDTGIKDYILLKDSGAPDSFQFGLNYYGGRISLEPTGNIVFYDSAGSEKFKIDRMIGYDAEYKRIDQMISYDLINDQSLILKFDKTGASFPVLLDPSVVNID